MCLSVRPCFCTAAPRIRRPAGRNARSGCKRPGYRPKRPPDIARRGSTRGGFLRPGARRETAARHAGRRSSAARGRQHLQERARCRRLPRPRASTCWTGARSRCTCAGRRSASGQNLRNSAGLLVKIIKDPPTRSRVVSPELEATLKGNFRRQQEMAERQDKEDLERTLILEYEHSRMQLAELLFQDMPEPRRPSCASRRAKCCASRSGFSGSRRTCRSARSMWRSYRISPGRKRPLTRSGGCANRPSRPCWLLPNRMPQWKTSRSAARPSTVL